RRRIPDRVVFDHVIAALVHGSGYERLATPGCSDRTIRRRLAEWAEAGIGPQLLRIVLDAFDRMIGLNLDDLAVDGAITKSPCGGEVAGRSPVDRGKQGTKRSVATDGDGIPLHLVAARANDHDSPLLEPTLAGICDMIGPLPERPNMHLDRGYDSGKTRDLLAILGYHGEIAVKGTPAPIQAGKRWPVERCHSWMNGYGKLRRTTDKRKIIVEFYLNLAATLTVIRRLIN
ncbi:IS5 family transposase, partial [Pseudonocardia sp. H11422]|uniref:IS5 family transposase n=1 Tax=Pseudonocardia sp. H11422 TaxID=2835866 RepID=UPI001BDD4475